MSEVQPTPSPSPPARGPGGRFLPRDPPPERQALAAAITRHRAAREDHARTGEAIARAGLRRLDAAAAGVRAETALAKAKAGEGETLVAALLADAEPGSSPVREAEAALTAAQEQHAALGGAEQALRERLAETEREVERAGRLLRERAVEVLATAPAVLAAVDRLAATQRELVEVGDQVLWLVRTGVLKPQPGMSFNARAGDLPTKVRVLVERLSQPPTAWHDIIAEVAGSWRVFSAALEALESDAAAVLP